MGPLNLSSKGRVTEQMETGVIQIETGWERGYKMTNTDAVRAGG